MKKVDYNLIASSYNNRYKKSPLPLLSSFLSGLSENFKSKNILEIGCGTGHWLDSLKTNAEFIFGLDSSVGMLKEARMNSNCNLVCGDADALPYKNNFFDLIMSINSFHFYKAKERFLNSVFKLLRADGVFFIYTLDLQHPGFEWYLYDYFSGTFEYDLLRFPSINVIKEWFESAGFSDIRINNLDCVESKYLGDEVLNDNFLNKNQASQLAALSDAEYSAGINKIQNALDDKKNIPLFKTKLFFTAVSGRKN